MQFPEFNKFPSRATTAAVTSGRKRRDSAPEKLGSGKLQEKNAPGDTTNFSPASSEAGKVAESRSGRLSRKGSKNKRAERSKSPSESTPKRNPSSPNRLSNRISTDASTPTTGQFSLSLANIKKLLPHYEAIVKHDEAAKTRPSRIATTEDFGPISSTPPTSSSASSSNNSPRLTPTSSPAGNEALANVSPFSLKSPSSSKYAPATIAGGVRRRNVRKRGPAANKGEKPTSSTSPKSSSASTSADEAELGKQNKFLLDYSNLITKLDKLGIELPPEARLTNQRFLAGGVEFRLAPITPENPTIDFQYRTIPVPKGPAIIIPVTQQELAKVSQQVTQQFPGETIHTVPIEKLRTHLTQEGYIR